MAMSTKMNGLIRLLRDSSVTEANAIADCLVEIASNAAVEDDGIPWDADEYLIGVLGGIKEWTEFCILTLRKED